MGFISKFLGSTALKTIALNGVAVPIVATIVGYEVQKRLVKRDAKELTMLQQQVNNVQAKEVDAEIVDVDSEFRQ